jgi:hypothetical protein
MKQVQIDRVQAESAQARLECSQRAVVGRATDDIVDAVTRLLDLMAQPEDADLLGPLVVDEILIRLLRTPIGNRIAQIGHTKSGVQRMADAVTWIRAHFRATSHGRGDGRVRPHERVIISSALQSGDHDEPAAVSESAPAARSPAADAVSGHGREPRVPPRRLPECVAVQQEYSRFFGYAPSKDIARLRDEGFAPSNDRG